MYRKYLLTAAIVASFAAPAFATTTYYVGQSARTHKCSVGTKKPNGKTVVMVGTDTYTNKADAERAMKAAAQCKSKT